MTIIVTGAAGFIGSNLIKGLNARGERNIIAVDNLTRADKFSNLVDCEIADYLDKAEFLAKFESEAFGKVRAVFHQGACSDNTESDGRYVMENNFRYGKALLEACLAQGRQFIYASSSAVYGDRQAAEHAADAEVPLNIYGYSKLLFDQVVRRSQADARSQVVGLRYFNVYGPREAHKGRAASVAFQSFNQFRADGTVRLHGEYGGYGPGCQRHDIVSVDDVVKVNLFFLDHPERSGLFDVGTGHAVLLNDVAATVINTLRAAEDKPALSVEELVQEGVLEYIKFPDALRGRHQCFTQADTGPLQAAGYREAFRAPQDGVARYCHWLLQRAV
jgi:ADP-L-glycero-D-manno-heptose 6-epimerase